ncbi:hypothetical protein [Streptomyces violaceorubidus]|uniref:hypothetical protein n=1 Tax=Streptomyces violaceorubidus TaxID=284042 RepID=UPI0004C14EBB
MLLARCEEESRGDTFTACASDPYAGLSTAQDVDLYTRRLTYGFSRTGEAGQALDVPSDAAALLVTAFPDLTAEQRARVLEQTATDSGYPLDLTGSGGPAWRRINLAAAMAPDVEVNADGSVTVTNFSDATNAGAADASALTVGGGALDACDPEVSTYVVDWPEHAGIPAVGAVPSASGARVRVTEGSDTVSSLPPSPDHPHRDGDLGQRRVHPGLHGRLPAHVGRPPPRVDRVRRPGRRRWRGRGSLVARPGGGGDPGLPLKPRQACPHHRRTPTTAVRRHLTAVVDVTLVVRDGRNGCRTRWTGCRASSTLLRCPCSGESRCSTRWC